MHGYLSSKESFYYQLKALAEGGFRAIAPDMPFFGASFSPDGAWSVGDYAEWLKSFIKASGAEGAHLVAHSFGARVALKLLARDGALADRLLITGGAGIVKPRSAQYLKSVRRYRVVKRIFPRYAERRFGSEEYRSLPPLMRESYKKIVNEDLRGCAAKIKNRTLLIYGREDTTTPPLEEGVIFNALIGGSRLNVIDGGHFCFSQNPTPFNKLMLGFFKER